MSNQAKTLYLMLTITFLAFLTVIYLNVPENYSMALFTTISLPVVYSARYFSQNDNKYFKKLSWTDEVIRDMIAVTSAFIVGYIMYVATSRDFSTSGMILYGIAFALVLFLRFWVNMWYNMLSTITDADNPLIIVGMSFLHAVVGLGIELVVFGLV